MADMNLENQKKFRSLKNYIEQHPIAKGARTLTEARKLAFGNKRSQHGLLGKTIHT